MSNIIKNMTKISKNPNIEKWFCHSDRRPQKKIKKIIQIHEMILLPHKQQFFFDTF